jgi:hypothetical protein
MYPGRYLSYPRTRSGSLFCGVSTVVYLLTMTLVPVDSRLRELFSLLGDNHINLIRHGRIIDISGTGMNCQHCVSKQTSETNESHITLSRDPTLDNSYPSVIVSSR